MEEPALIELTRPPFFFSFVVAPFYSSHFFSIFFYYFFFFIILPGGPIARPCFYYPKDKADQHRGWCLSGWTCLVGCFSSVCKFLFILSLMLHDVCCEKSMPSKMSCSRHVMGKIAKMAFHLKKMNNFYLFLSFVLLF